MKLCERTTWTLSILGLLTWSTPTHAEPPIDYRLLVLRVDFVDAPGVFYGNPADFRNGYVDTLVDFWTEMSNGQLNIITTVIDEPMTLQERWHYHSCRACRDPRGCGDESNTWCDCVAAGDDAETCGKAPAASNCLLGLQLVAGQALS